MLTLDPRPAFDLWRNAGADIPTATAQALAVPATPSTVEIVEKYAFPNGTIIRGQTFSFPRSLFEVYGTGSWGPSGSPKYSWGGCWLSLAPNSRAILMDCVFRCESTITPPHHQEKGFNVFGDIPETSQLILINPTFINADSALILGGTHSHAVNVVLKATRAKNSDGRFGHYGVRIVGEWNVLEGCNVQTRFHHDLSTQGTRYAVYKKIIGLDLVNDFHAWSGDSTDDHNLYYDLNHGLGTQPFGAGGAASNLPWDGDGATFYKIRKGDGTPITNFPAWLHATVIPTSEPEVPMPNKFVIGEMAQATSQVNVRSTPSKPSNNSNLIGTQPAGSQAAVLDGPVKEVATGITFWKLNYPTVGWVGEDKLIKGVLPPPVPDIRDRVKAKLMSGEGMTDEEAEWLLL